MACYGIEITGLGGRHGGTDEDVERAADSGISSEMPYVRALLAPIPQAEADAMQAAWVAREEGEDHDPVLAERWEEIMGRANSAAHAAGTEGWAHPERVDGVIASIV